MQVALGRVAERRGDPEQAMAAYQEALKRDKRRSDAYQRLAVLHDRKGEFRQSAELYRQALEADPGNPDIYCDQGYSLYLQRRWADAEMSMRQAIVLRPEDARAHNNLGLILAHDHRDSEAVAEFRKAGASRADAHNNMAFALTTEGRWPDARAQYRLALAADPTSERARVRLRELDTLLAKADSNRSAAPQLAKVETRRPATPHDSRLVPASATAPAPSPSPRPNPSTSPPPPR
jgi:Tfp pilus assembly protein PilF